ncbi:MAG: ethanolamine ammonia-lyase subunit EutB [Gammaproteobacteria bacterium]
MDRENFLLTLVLANDFKEGDLALGGSLDQQTRADARAALAAINLGTLARSAIVEDSVSAALSRSISPLPINIARLSLGEVKRTILTPDGVGWVEAHRAYLSSEIIAVLVKLMSNIELSVLARRLFNPLPCRRPNGTVAIGSPQHFGSRIQPNSPGDDEEEILFSILEGLSYGCGDVILGLNPASDDLDTIIRLEKLLQDVVERLQLPTRFCVLSDIVKQDAARAHTRVDVGFQSLAGTSAALLGMVGLDIDGITDLALGFPGLYFETGQGSEITNGAAAGVDMVTLEARSYGVARYIRQQAQKRDPSRPVWMIVNDVAGFIGPEVFRTSEQLLRACLEDTVMAKLHGLTMGLDVCSTFHMGIEPAALQALTQTVVAQAAPAYLMAVAGNADPMLGYLTTSFREHPELRRRNRRRITSAMQQRLSALGVRKDRGHATLKQGAELYSVYRKAGGDTSTYESLRRQGMKKIARLQQAGYDLGYGHGLHHQAPPEVTKRLERIYSHAQQALRATLAEAVIHDVSPQHLRVRTCAKDRDDFIAHPSAGERISDQEIPRVISLYPSRRPRVQIVLSDGLNANALNVNLRAVLPAIRYTLSGMGYEIGDRELIIINGRVRAGYHIGALLEVEVIVHLIGERPGTGLDTLSAYLTYGRDPAGRPRWRPDLDHAYTTAVCGIHPQGKQPAIAAEEIARNVERMLEEHRSGVALGAHTGVNSPP